MRIGSAVKWVFAFGVLALAAGPAGAQQPAGGATTPGAAAPPTEGQVGFQRKTTLTPQEQLLESGKHLSRMEGAAGGIRKMLEEARRQRDVVKTLCLNDKLSQIDVAIRSARDRREQLKSAVARNDAELSNHEFTILTVLRQRSEQLVAEANQCIGEESAFVGDTRTTVQVDPRIPPDETPYPPTDPTLIIGPPQCTSCTL
jgi:DNA-binding FrmR family transcriptional regulator